MVARGVEKGPVLGITAAVHGNELNGLPVIQRLFETLDVTHLRGTVVGVLVVNVPGLLMGIRKFNDGVDPNHIMPGVEDGSEAQVYVYRFMDRIVAQLEYLIDLHTASTGRKNSYYIRSDLNDPITTQMALLQNAQIIVNNPPKDGTLRGAAESIGINAVTLEVGDPSRFQRGMIRSSMTGIHNMLVHLDMIEGDIDPPELPAIICDKSYWIYTRRGGLLVVHPEICDIVEAGTCIATMRNIFGDVVEQYFAPETGIVIGKSTQPVNQTGGRILHLGIMRAESARI
jgi:predicted deacylase